MILRKIIKQIHRMNAQMHVNKNEKINENIQTVNRFQTQKKRMKDTISQIRMFERQIINKTLKSFKYTNLEFY